MGLAERRYLVVLGITVHTFFLLVFIFSCSAGGLGSWLTGHCNRLQDTADFTFHSDFTFGLSRVQITPDYGTRSYRSILHNLQRAKLPDAATDPLEDLISTGQSTTAMLVLSTLLLVCCFVLTFMLWPLDQLHRARQFAPLACLLTTLFYMLTFVVWSSKAKAAAHSFLAADLAASSIAISYGHSFNLLVTSFVFTLFTAPMAYWLVRLRNVHSEVYVPYGDESYTDPMFDDDDTERNQSGSANYAKPLTDRGNDSVSSGSGPVPYRSYQTSD